MGIHIAHYDSWQTFGIVLLVELGKESSCVAASDIAQWAVGSDKEELSAALLVSNLGK